MKKLLQILPLSLALLFFAGCEEETPEILTDVMSGIQVLDVGSRGNANDIVVLFDLHANEMNVNEVRLALVKQSEMATFNLDKAKALQPEHYTSATYTGGTTEQRLKEEQKDVNGEDIKEETIYVVRFILVTPDDIYLDKAGRPIQLTDDFHLAGRLTGGLSAVGVNNEGNTYNFEAGISTELVYNKNLRTLSGPFYYTENFISYFNAQGADGEIVLELGDDGTSVKFDLVTHYPNFYGPGEACGGVYEGTGKIMNYRTIEVDFTGVPCNGTDANGSFTLD